MNKEIDDIIKQKNYHDLSGDDLRLLEREGVKKEDFIQLKLLFQQLEVDKLENNFKANHVKERLDQEFQQKFKKSRVVPLWRDNKQFYAQPIFHAAAAIIMLFLVFNFLNLEDNTTNLAENTVVNKKEVLNKKQPKKEKESVSENNPQKKQELKDEIEKVEVKQEVEAENVEIEADLRSDREVAVKRKPQPQLSPRRNENIANRFNEIEKVEEDLEVAPVADELKINEEVLSNASNTGEQIAKTYQYNSINLSTNNTFETTFQSNSSVQSEFNLKSENLSGSTVYDLNVVMLVPNKTIDEELDLLTPLF